MEGEGVRYEECLCNHAAYLGRERRDGCQHFCPKPNLFHICEVCGCHQDCHRRMVVGNRKVCRRPTHPCTLRVKPVGLMQMKKAMMQEAGAAAANPQQVAPPPPPGCSCIKIMKFSAAQKKGTGSDAEIDELFRIWLSNRERDQLMSAVSNSKDN